MRHVPSHTELIKIKRTNQLQVENPEKWFNQDGCFIAVHREWRVHQPVSYLSVGIRLFDQTYWNHTAIIVIINGQVWVMESNQAGVVVMSFKTWAKKYGVKHWIVYPPLKNQPFETYSQFLGRGYDFKSVFIYQPWYKIFGKWHGKEGIEGSDKTYCTEIFSYANSLDNAHLLTTGDIIEKYQETFIEPIFKPL